MTLPCACACNEAHAAGASQTDQRRQQTSAVKHEHWLVPVLAHELVPGQPSDVPVLELLLEHGHALVPVPADSEPQLVLLGSERAWQDSVL